MQFQSFKLKAFHPLDAVHSVVHVNKRKGQSIIQRKNVKGTRNCQFHTLLITGTDILVQSALLRWFGG